MEMNDISYQIRGAAFNVYNNLGPGLLESVYQYALAHELSKMGLNVHTEVPVPVVYNDKKLELGFRLDVLVEGRVLVEIKSVEEIHKVHHKQVLTYLKLTGCKLGLLINFNTDDLKRSIFRKVNNL
jgi:GxxExxY protein